MSKFLRALRRAISESGKTRYRISQATGIDQAQLSRLMNGEAGASVANIEKLLAYLRLEIRLVKKKKVG